MLEAANVEFALRGLHGASTDAIARRAGISQPYLFRLFGSKKELFIAVIDDCFARTLESFRAAAAGMSGAEALEAIGRRLRATSIESDRTHAPGAAAVVRGVGRGRRHPRRRPRAASAASSTTSRRCSGADRVTVAQFFAKGMLMNVLAAMEYSLDERAERLLGRASGRRGAGRTVSVRLFSFFSKR